MYNSPLKKYLTIAMVVWLPLINGLKKTIDYTKNETYKTLSLHNYSTKELKTDFSINPSVLNKKVKDNLNIKKTTGFETIHADNEYLKHYLPPPHYHLDSNALEQATQNRIENSVIPRFKMVNGVDDYKNRDRIKKNITDACLTHVFWEILRMKILSKDTYKILWEPGKKVWTTIDNLGWESLTTTTDKISYFDTLEKTLVVPEHYINILKEAQNSKAGDILVFRNATSNNLKNARKEGWKNGTHAAFSHGRIKQKFNIDELWIWKAELNQYKNDIEKKAFCIYKLMTFKSWELSRIQHYSMIGNEKAEIERIKNLLNEYPKLLDVYWEEKSNTVSFEWTFITHDLHQILEAHFLFELTALNKNTINPKCENSSASWWRFLLTGAFRPKEENLKFFHYTKLSPLYNDIYNFRKELIKKEKILYTHIVHFDDVDKNKNNKIDKYDKTVWEILDDMTEEYYRITYNNIWVSSDEFKKIKNQKEWNKTWWNLEKDIRPYLKIYLEMLGVMDNLPIHTSIPIPSLSEENKKWIIKHYKLYKLLMYKKFDTASQDIYTEYIKEKLKTISLNEFKSNPIVIYPFIKGDDPISLTKQITSYIDIIIKNHPDRVANTETNFWELSKDELSEIYKLIKSDIILPERLERGQKAYINLPKVLLNVTSYLEFKNKLLTSTINSIDEDIIGISDQTAKNLWIHPTIRSLQKQKIIRESGIDISRRNLADIRTLGKMTMEKIWLDDKEWVLLRNSSRLKKNVYINSEGILQIRIEDNYLNNNDEIKLIEKSAIAIKDNATILWLEQQQVEKLNQLLKQLIITKDINSPETKNQFDIERNKLKSLLSEIIKLSPWARNSNDLWSLLIIKLDSYATEDFILRYWRIVQKSLWINELNSEEVSFIQQFTLKAHQLWQVDADKAFKIYMSTFLISRWAMYNKIDSQDKTKFYSILKNLNSYRKKESSNILKRILWKKENNSQRYKEFIENINIALHSNENKYLEEIKSYLNNNKNITELIIPHYSDRRNTKLGPNGGVFEDNESWIYINRRIFEREELKELNKYIINIEKNNNLWSAWIWFIFSILWYIWIKKANKKIT